jgi:predicted RND superfamily exporter protein
MWYKLGQNIVKNRVVYLIVLFVVTAFMGWQATKIKLSYDFTRAIPTTNQKYIDYQNFLKKFGGDAGTIVIGIENKNFFEYHFFNEVGKLHQALKKVQDVQEVLSVPEALALIKDTIATQLLPQKIFHYPYQTQGDIDNDVAIFNNLPFYKGILYNSETNAYLLAITVNKDTINSKSRTRVINDIMLVVDSFNNTTKSKVFVSGLPYIRTRVGDKIKDEMNWFLIGSFLLSAITLLLFFRSFSAMFMSLTVVAIGVVWSIGTMVLFGYKITLLTALIPPLIVVIGVPNCIYFLNKYHVSFKETNDKTKALVNMVGRMGIVTLFCNIAAAIGFIVFAFTHSQLLKEFGLVSGINIMALFFISLFFIPAILSYLPNPSIKHVQYLDNKYLEKILLYVEKWVFHHTKWVWTVTIVVTAFAVIGIFKLKSEGFIVDDLPKQDKIYVDLKWFEKNFKGVMPLEVVIEIKKKAGFKRSTQPLKKIDAFSTYLAANNETAKPLSLVEGLKFAKQSFFDNDSLSYNVPEDIDMAMMGSYLKSKNANTKTGVAKLLNSFIDTNYQTARISVNMKDIGSKQLPIFLNNATAKANEIFDTANYKVTFTGSSITFLEGSRFIINGLKESIIWAFSLIALCMLFLFRSIKIVICSLIPNVIPMVITAGVMGWAGISLKPSTVLVFSVALGIVIDVTIRFLINYKQELPHYNFQINQTIISTIKHTGISIIYTSLVLIAGFIIFCFSGFGGTKALGWLTSLTLIVGTVTNLLLLPVLLKTILNKNE